MTHIRRWSVLTGAGILAAAASASHGQVTATWLSAASGNWSDPTRWSSNPDFPNNNGTTYTAVINATGAAYGVTVDQSIILDEFMIDSPDATLMLGAGFTLRTLGNWGALNGAIIDGQALGGGIRADGTTTFGNSTFIGVSNFLATGPVVYSPSTTVTFDDTDIDHGDGSALWGAGGDIVLANGSTILNGPDCTFTISGSQQLRFSGAGATPAFTNMGTIVRDTAAGVADVMGVTFDNQGTLDVRSGTFRADTVANVSANMLSGGVYRFGGGSIDFAGASITTNAATVEIAPGAGTFAAFDSLATNAGSGVIRVLTGRTFATAGALANDGLVEVEPGAGLTVTAGLSVSASGATSLGAGATLTSAGDAQNLGALSVGPGATFAVAPGFSLLNVAAQTLTGGSYAIQGDLRADNLAGLQTISAAVTLDGPGSALRDGSNTDVAPGIRTIASGGEFMLAGGRDLTTTGNLTLGATGALRVGAGSDFVVGGTITNYASGTFSGGIVDVAGRLQFNGAAVNVIDGDISLNDPAADIVDENNASAFAALDTITANGALGISNGRNLALAGALTSAGGLAVGNGSMLSTPASITQTAGTTTLANGSITASGGFSLTGGTLQGTGTINGQALIDGTLSPGASPGLLMFANDLSIAPNALFVCEIGGRARGSEHDAIDVGSLLAFDAGLAGAFRAALIDGFAPALGDRFYIASYETRQGQFERYEGLTGLPGGLWFEVLFDAPSPNPNDSDLYMVLVVVPAPGPVGLALGLGLAAARRRRR
jgi:hypothetical protein